MSNWKTMCVGGLFSPGGLEFAQSVSSQFTCSFETFLSLFKYFFCLSPHMSTSTPGTYTDMKLTHSALVLDCFTSLKMMVPFSLCVTLGIVSSITSLHSLSFPSAMSDLSLIPCCVFFISDIVVFISGSLNWVLKFKKKFVGKYNIKFAILIIFKCTVQRILIFSPVTIILWNIVMIL